MGRVEEEGDVAERRIRGNGSWVMADDNEVQVLSFVSLATTVRPLISK